MGNPTSQRQDMTAIIYDRRGNILSIGKNNYLKTHPLQARLAQKHQQPYKIFIHAEIHAITRCANISKAHKISIFRFDKFGNPTKSKPCKICQDAISMTPIKIIEHT